MHPRQSGAFLKYRSYQPILYQQPLAPLRLSTFMSSNAPNTTLYIKNLNDGINKEELRAQLYALFLPYGKILDVVALKTTKMRGQAFVVFADLAAATTAMRSWDGESFYDKPMVSRAIHCALILQPLTSLNFVRYNSISSTPKQSPMRH